MHCISEVTVIGDQGTLQTGIWGERLLFSLSRTVGLVRCVGNGVALDNVSVAV